MPRPFSLTIGGPDLPFSRGLNTAKRPAELVPNEAQIAENVDLSAGTLRGAFGLGTKITPTVVANAKFAACSGGANWVSSTDPDTACRIDYRTIAYTQIDGGSYDYPRVQQGSANARLGVPAPGSGMIATGGSRPNRSYAVVFIDSTISYPGAIDFALSNPSPIVSSGNSGATLTNIPGADVYGRIIYATEEGDPDGVLYRYKTIPWGDTSWTDTGGSYGGYAVNKDAPLDWGSGGDVTNETTPRDYSPANYLSVLADEMYGPGGLESGVMFGVLAALSQSYVAWTHAGKPWAWPTKFQYNLHETVHALVVWQNAVFAFTDTSVWSFSGTADYAITPERIVGVHPIKKGFGKTAKATPFGVVYVAREGLALFDGISSRIITKGILDPLTWLDGATYANAAYYDGAYRLNLWGKDTVLVVEVGDDGVKVTSMDGLDAADLVIAPRSSSEPGLIVADQDGDLFPWRPADGSAVTGATRQPWEWMTARLTMGAASRLKYFRRMRISCALNGGTLDIQIVARSSEGASLATFTQTINSTSPTEFWLPTTMFAHSVDVKLTPSSGAVEVYEFTITGDVTDA